MVNYQIDIPPDLIDFASKQKDKVGSWDKLRADCQETLLFLDKYMDKQVTEEEWLEIIDKAEEYEKSQIEFERCLEDQSISDPDIRLMIKRVRNGYWDEYYRTLCDKFSIKSAQEIRSSCECILKRLSYNEEPSAKYEPVKGAVFGSVQSGKTANMEGLIAMGADHGFNMFVILSGNITSLRDQTVMRLKSDFSKAHTLNFIDVNTYRSGTNVISPDQKNVIVCLKTPGSLKKLHAIITKNESVRRQLHVIVMDDEGDLATPNGNRKSSKERATINKTIMNIVNCCSMSKSEPFHIPYRSMNYISYTATPFAVLLNESTPESLYPKDFIISLPTSDRYFGPCQIFGCENIDCQYPGMSIINSNVYEKDFYPFEEGECDEICGPFLDSLCWFLCCVAILRLNKWEKPVSMLINTNSRKNQHNNVGKNLLNYIKENADEIEDHCEVVYWEQTKRFTLEDLESSYPHYYGDDYQKHKSSIIQYPRYNEIRDIVHDLLLRGPLQIPLVDESVEYTGGIHICIEDSSEGVLEDTPYNVHTRLMYPNEFSGIYAPAFIAIGGNALSRGFTLEGLVSTFFIRPVTQADTLMQMGRWFGYRDGYELLPRVWMSEECCDDFEFLSELDADLRSEIRNSNRLHEKPSDTAIRMLAIPKAIRLSRLTSANKSKGMIDATVSYTGKRQEFARFIDEPGLFKGNLDMTRAFLTNLTSNPSVIKDDSRGKNWGNVVRWRNVSMSDVYHGFFEKFRTGIVDGSGRKDLQLFLEWLDLVSGKSVLDSWTVVLAGSEKGEPFVLDKDTSVGKIVRGKERKVRSPDHVVIKTLWNKADYFRDIFPEELNNDQGLIDGIRNGNFFGYMRDEERRIAGKENVPSLFIYCIDGNGDARSANKDNLNLGEGNDVIAFFIDIPCVKFPGDADRVKIQLQNQILEDDD